MRSFDELVTALRRLDRKPFGAFKSIKGSYGIPELELTIEHVQGDPFAEPSRISVLVPRGVAELPSWCRSDPGRRVSTADFLNRHMARELKRVERSRGSGKSGAMKVQVPGQQILERTSLTVTELGEVQARFKVGLPAQGRRILGHQAVELLTEDVPDAVENSLRAAAVDLDALRAHVEAVEDSQALRGQLAERGLVAFVGEGASLPRASGIDDRPLGKDAVLFESPPSLRTTLTAPNAGEVVGMGVPRGVTLIVGGGYHGKSTLLHALERGVYDHRTGDGRERVVTLSGAVKVRAEDGRPVTGVDISSFIGDLPGGQPTETFHSHNASGSTSQAAAIVEAMEVGAELFLVDEDTSATNFMIRDARMQALIADEHEPITPYIDRVRQLYDERGISSVIVVGGSGDYFDVADTVIAMRAYRPDNVTDGAKRIMAERPSARRVLEKGLPTLGRRSVDAATVRVRRGKRDVSVKVAADDRLLLGEQELDVAAVEQLVERGQLRAIAQALVWAKRNAFGEGVELSAAIDVVMRHIADNGLAGLMREPSGELAAFRRFELAGVLNRVRGLEVDPFPLPG